MVAEHPMFSENAALQQQLKHMMPQYIQQVSILSLFIPKITSIFSRPHNRLLA